MPFAYRRPGRVLSSTPPGNSHDQADELVAARVVWSGRGPYLVRAGSCCSSIVFPDGSTIQICTVVPWAPRV